jgi:hypothetical protein
MPSERFRSDVVGIAWCRKEDYDAFCAIFEDAHDLPGTWHEFAKRLEKSEEHYRANGHIIERVDINPQIFPDWCIRKGYRVNAHARAQFAYEIAVARHSGDN